MPTDRLISQDAPSIINGVSRQPAAQRLTSQAEEQINMVSDVALGVRRRPPMEHIALLGGPVAGAPPSGGYYTHLINRGDGQQFIAIIEDGDVNVYNLETGAEVTVNDGGAAGSPGSYSYLDIAPSASVTAENSFEAITVADYTFIVNKRKTVAASGSPSPDRTHAHEFLYFAKTGLQGYERQTWTFGATSIDTGATSDRGTDHVINAVCAALGISATPNDETGVTAGTTNWKFTRHGRSCLHGYQFQNALEEVSVSSTNGDIIDGQIMLATSPAGDPPQTPAFSDLPYRGVDGFVVKISGSEGSDEDEYYLKYDSAKKTWLETVKPGLDDNFNADTMPHALVYNSGTGQFSFQPLTWDARMVGDELSAPVPSFVGAQIKGITLHKNRLILVADENTIATEAGNLFNFWPTTATTLVESDPFDVAGTSNRVSIWDHLINFEGNVTLFSAVGDTVGELVGATDAPLTIKNARIEERGVYAFSDVKPVVMGSGLFFVLDRGSSSAVYRYSKVDVFTFSAEEVSGHVRGYIPANVDHMKSSPAMNMIVLRSLNEPTSLYTYRTHQIGNEQVMASWGKWDLGSDVDVLNFDFIESKMYILVQRDDGLHLQVFDFGKEDEDEGAGATPLGYRVHLDGLVALTGVYNPVTDFTTWTLPYTRDPDATYMAVRGGAWGTGRGSSITLLPYNSFIPTIVLGEGDQSAHPAYIGKVYNSEWDPSEAVLTSGRQGGPAAHAGGRLQLYRGRVGYLDTGAFDAVITSTEDAEEYVTPFRTNIVNVSTLSAVGLDTGVFDFAIGGHSKKTRVGLKSAGFLPCTFTSYEWEGRYVQRSDSV